MKKFLKFIFFGSVILLMSSAFFSEQKLMLAGSTTIQKRVLEPALEAINAETGIALKILGIGTGQGFDYLLKEKVPASIASSPLNSILEKAGIADDGTFKEHVIVRDVIVPIVHKTNPVSELSWQQLADINTGKITNWKEVGGEDMPVKVVTSHSGSATRAVFQKQVMKKAAYVENAMKVKSTREEVDLAGKLKGAIGAVSEGFVKLNPGKVKIIKTKEISRPLSFITKGEPTADVQKVIDYLMTPDAKKLFK
ncbi:MAG: phosphate ABC transporter substrate-binding protein [Calditrichaeota bacterium]|nr:MAG: phosphate ABC transporter substrate-binding protein [Calditrichota bacterium]